VKGAVIVAVTGLQVPPLGVLVRVGVLVGPVGVFVRVGVADGVLVRVGVNVGPDGVLVRVAVGVNVDVDTTGVLVAVGPPPGTLPQTSELFTYAGMVAQSVYAAGKVPVVCHQSLALLRLVLQSFKCRVV
jgi:hypothetical protein